MKKITLLLCAAIISINGFAQFNTYFLNKTMRFDFFHAGNSQEEAYYFKDVIEEPYWGGTKTNLIDDLNYGNQMVKVFDKASGKLIYSRSYCTLFNEWQTVPQAKVTSKAYPESVVFPYPKAPVRVELHARNRQGIFVKKFEHNVDPNHYSVCKPKYKLSTFDITNNGNNEHCLDIVIIPEGYDVNSRAKFDADSRKFAEEMLRYSPFKENAGRINLKAVWAPSQDNNVTIPGDNSWRNTATKAKFYTFDTERYQMIDDFQNLRDIAGNVAYDYIYVISNTTKYGGGGIYNFYGISAAGNLKSGKIYVHEFGHVLLGLGDEYTGGVAYSDYYPIDLEPWEENLTTLVNFESKQWSKMLPKGTPVPTLIDKNDPEKLGVFEGGGYVNRGVYRPKDNCIMNNLHNAEAFCPVCSYGIQKMIDWVCK